MGASNSSVQSLAAWGPAHFYTAGGGGTPLRRSETTPDISSTGSLCSAIEGFNFDAGTEQLREVVYFWRIHTVLDLEIEQWHGSLCPVILHLGDLEHLEAFGFISVLISSGSVLEGRPRITTLTGRSCFNMKLLNSTPEDSSHLLRAL
ncbi:hypothetical protein TNCV_2418111 [Trichonephila clavipes]|nr:hypothetical protein TNCV_2418111 [Trichonephila clavipes]